MMNLLIAPEVSSSIITQTTQLSYILRNMARINGEDVGLPKAIPDHRKADYLFRDYYMTFIMTGITEVATRVAESRNVMPLQVRFMQLNQLQSLYPQNGFHTPHLPNYFQVQNFVKEYPEYIRSHILGSNVNARSYWLVPELIEKKVVPEMFRRYEHPSKIAEARLLAHHLRRLFTPKHYIDNFLVPTGRLSTGDAGLLKDHLSRFNTLAGAYDSARRSGNTQALKAALSDYTKHLAPSDSRWLHRLANMSPSALLEKIQGPTVRTILETARTRGWKYALNHYRRLDVLHPDHFMLDADKHILRPLLKKLAPTASNTKTLLLELANDFSRNKIRANQAISVFRASELWLKIPLNFALSTAIYGIVSGYIDVKHIQSFQDQLVKLRGDARESIGPTYIGTAVGLGLFAALMASKSVRNLGHVASFVIASIGFNVGQIGTTWWLLKRKLSLPRDPAKQPYKIISADKAQWAERASAASDIKTPRLHQNG
jgi:hypothetical protein